MNLYLFPRVRQLTDRFHSGGGLVIVAQSKEHAQEIAGNNPNIVLDTDDWDDAIVYELAGNPEDAVYVFPDAGCC